MLLICIAKWRGESACFFLFSSINPTVWGEEGRDISWTSDSFPQRSVSLKVWEAAYWESRRWEIRNERSEEPNLQVIRWVSASNHSPQTIPPPLGYIAKFLHQLGVDSPPLQSTLVLEVPDHFGTIWQLWNSWHSPPRVAPPTPAAHSLKQLLTPSPHQHEPPHSFPASTQPSHQCSHPHSFPTPHPTFPPMQPPLQLLTLSPVAPPNLLAHPYQLLSSMAAN